MQKIFLEGFGLTTVAQRKAVERARRDAGFISLRVLVHEADLCAVLEAARLLPSRDHDDREKLEAATSRLLFIVLRGDLTEGLSQCDVTEFQDALDAISRARSGKRRSTE